MRDLTLWYSPSKASFHLSWVAPWVALRIRGHATFVAEAHAAREATIPDHTWASFFVVGCFNSEKALILFSLGLMKINPLSLSLSAEILQPPNSMTVEIKNLLGFI